MKRAVAIRHIDFEDLGVFATPLRECGYDIHYIEAGAGNFETCTDADLLVVLGGPMGVYESDRFPFLDAEIRLIRDHIATGRPILGICLGAQLIAQAMGGRVFPGNKKEIGFAPIELTAAGTKSPLAFVHPQQSVLHWHGDTFDLPPGAELLASTTAYRNQAFSAGPHVLALQFHLEAGAGIERWLSGHADELRPRASTR